MEQNTHELTEAVKDLIVMIKQTAVDSKTQWNNTLIKAVKLTYTFGILGLCETKDNCECLCISFKLFYYCWHSF